MSNYEMARNLEALTYAVLALINEVRELQSELVESTTDAVRDEVSDALIDMKDGGK